MPECTHWIQTCYNGTNYTSDQHIVVRAPCHEVEFQWQQQATLITPWENIPCQVMHNWPKMVWNEISKLPAATSIQQLCKQARLISPWENIPCHIFFLQAWGLICVFETSSQDSGTCQNAHTESWHATMVLTITPCENIPCQVMHEILSNDANKGMKWI